MSAKHLRAIALGVAGLLLLWGASELFSRGSDVVTGALALPPLAQSDVDTVAIVKGADSIVLARHPSNAWTVGGHRAGADAVTDLFQALKQGEGGPPELVAEDSSSFARLQVDSATGRWLRVRGGGKPLLALIVGARGSEYASAYVRRPDEQRVYLWHGRLAQLVDRGADEWRDKRIAAVEPDSVAAVEVERGKDRYRLTRADKAWTLNGAAADSGAVARALEKYRAITAAGFATAAQADSIHARRPARRLTLRDRRGAALVTLVFDSTAGGFWVRRTGGAAPAGEAGAVYRLNAWDADGLTPARNSLRPAAK